MATHRGANVIDITASAVTPDAPETPVVPIHSERHRHRERHGYAAAVSPGMGADSGRVARTVRSGRRVLSAADRQLHRSCAAAGRP